MNPELLNSASAWGSSFSLVLFLQLDGVSPFLFSLARFMLTVVVDLVDFSVSDGVLVVSGV